MAIWLGPKQIDKMCWKIMLIDEKYLDQGLQPNKNKANNLTWLMKKPQIMSNNAKYLNHRAL